MKKVFKRDDTKKRDDSPLRFEATVHCFDWHEGRISFLMQVETLLQEALRSVGIWEELSNDQCKQIAQLSVRYSEKKGPLYQK